jgi:hypothetical protein
MNTLLLKKFTPEILRGVQSLGFKPGAHRGILPVKQAEALAEQTGKTIGELALLGIEADASPEQQKRHRALIRETMELMAAFDSRPVAGHAAGGQR